MRPRLLFVSSALCAIFGCAHATTDPALEPLGSPDALTRATPASPEQIAAAGAAVLERFRLATATVEPERGRVISEDVRLHERWFDAPVEARIVCGTGFSRIGRELEPDELRHAQALTREMPITLRIGFDAEPRPAGSSTRLIVQATGHPAALSPLGHRDVACSPTRHFVDQLFELLQAQLPHV